MAEELAQALQRKREADEARNQALAFLRINQICDLVGHRKSWVWAAVRAGTFPPPIHIGTSARWVSIDVEAWQREQIERSRKVT